MHMGLLDTIQRKYPRKHFKKPVVILIKGFSQVVDGFEIGEGGLSFQTNMALNIGDQIVISFYIPDGGFFTLRGVIKNTIPEQATKPGHVIYGTSFREVSIPLKRQIRAYVARTVIERAI